MSDFFSGLSNFIILLIPLVSTIAVFVYLTFWIVALQKRREREAFYRYELARKAVEKGTIDEAKVFELLRDERRGRWLGRREGIRLGGLILLGLGIGMMVALANLSDHLVGFGAIPTFLGAALLFYGLFLAPKDSAPKGSAADVQAP